MTPTIRPAKESDLPFIVDIFNHEIQTSTSMFRSYLTDIQDRRAWLAKLKEGDYPCLVAEVRRDAGETVTVAWCSLGPYNPRPGYSQLVVIFNFVFNCWVTPSPLARWKSVFMFTEIINGVGLARHCLMPSSPKLGSSITTLLSVCDISSYNLGWSGKKELIPHSSN